MRNQYCQRNGRQYKKWWAWASHIWKSFVLWFRLNGNPDSSAPMFTGYWKRPDPGEYRSIASELVIGTRTGSIINYNNNKKKKKKHMYKQSYVCSGVRKGCCWVEEGVIRFETGVGRLCGVEIGWGATALACWDKLVDAKSKPYGRRKV